MMVKRDVVTSVYPANLQRFVVLIVAASAVSSPRTAHVCISRSPLSRPLPREAYDETWET
jgi:hypothetical protein